MRRSATLSNHLGFAADLGTRDATRLLVVGGGSAGMGIASKMARALPKGSVAVAEANESHYYQPGFTLVGAGLMSVAQNRASQESVTPPGVRWIRDRVAQFLPEQNKVVLRSGREVSYEMLVITTGLEIRFDMVEGLEAAMHDNSSKVSTIYLPHLAEKTNRLINTVKGGDLLFSFPNTLIKCAGAPQKICYIADDILRGRGIRDRCTLSYHTTLPRVFGMEKYADALMEIVKDRDINLRTRSNLVRVDHTKNRAWFENLDKPGEIEEREFSLLHAGPPCSSVKALRECPSLTDSSGWMDVDPKTLQSRNFTNIFGIGDCINTPNPKTAAAISSQLKAAEKNIPLVLQGKAPTAHYDGYASCPLVVSRNRVILAEFGPDGPLETMPFNQAKPTYFAFLLKRYFMPWLYWHGLIKGYWNGPATMRKSFHLGRGQ